MKKLFPIFCFLMVSKFSLICLFSVLVLFYLKFFCFVSCYSLFLFDWFLFGFCCLFLYGCFFLHFFLNMWLINDQLTIEKVKNVIATKVCVRLCMSYWQQHCMNTENIENNTHIKYACRHHTINNSAPELPSITYTLSTVCWCLKNYSNNNNLY